MHAWLLPVWRYDETFVAEAEWYSDHSLWCGNACSLLVGNVQCWWATLKTHHFLIERANKTLDFQCFSDWTVTSFLNISARGCHFSSAKSNCFHCSRHCAATCSSFWSSTLGFTLEFNACWKLWGSHFFKWRKVESNFCVTATIDREHLQHQTSVGASVCGDFCHKTS
jgi:hypothetical protein